MKSINFVTDYLNYMMIVNPVQKPNGSILFDFDKDFQTPAEKPAEEVTEEQKTGYSERS